MIKTVALLALMMIGCVQTGAVTCPDDRTCPVDSLCHPTLPLCVSEAAKFGCDGKVDGQPCVAGDDLGICETGYCIPGCGDGEADDREECDDGNFRSHDGCSSSCQLEQRSWIEWHPDWVGRGHHMLAYHQGRKELVMHGGADDVEAFDDQWTRDADLKWTHSVAPLGIRTLAMVAYDSKRNKVVLFGGSGISGAMSGDLGDTWEYDGTWTQVFPTVSPPARRGGQMTYDAARERVVLFSGRTGTNNFHPPDLWEYDGTTWSPITATSSTGTMPGGRTLAAFAWDAARNKIVMFGGQSIGTYNDLWEYSNAIWTQIPRVTDAPPVQRYGAAFAYSPARSKLVLYGGIVNNANAAADTWEYDGTWTPSVSPVIPPARANASFAYDTDRNALVLVGGVSADGGRHDDVWEYTTGKWVDASPRLFPSARQVRAAYDSARGQIVMFGGYGKSGAILDDTWIFDGTSWTEPVLSEAPPPKRYNQQLTYDAARDRVVMFGGARTASPTLTDTLEWNGSSWSTVTPATAPASRAIAAMADTAGPGVMMFSGLVLPGGASSYHETWEFDGTMWTQQPTPDELVASYGAAAAYDAINERTIVVATDGTTWSYANHEWTQITTTGPSVRVHASMIYDPWLERVVLYGGTSLNGLEDYADLWELVGDEWHSVPLFGVQPAVRSRPGFSALPAQRSLLLFGGVGLDDTWYLRYISATADEICDNSVDDDTDRQIDGADPDCP